MLKNNYFCTELLKNGIKIAFFYENICSFNKFTLYLQIEILEKGKRYHLWRRGATMKKKHNLFIIIN